MRRDVIGLCDANFILKRFINSNLPHLEEFLHVVSFADTWSRGEYWKLWAFSVDAVD